MDTQETTSYHAVLIAAVIIGTIIFYSFLSIIRQQRKYRLLNKAIIEAEITTLEKERLRLAADLHDELGPTLSAAKLKLSNIGPLPAEEEVYINEAMDHIDSILQQVHSIANDLVPNTLLRKGLIPAVEEFIDRVAADNSLDVSLQVEGLVELTTKAQLHIYRILQELIHNTIKHAKAKKLIIDINLKAPGLILSTADDGIGFLEEQAKYKGLGLSNLKSRTEILQGEMFFLSAPGKGTRYTFHFPHSILKITNL